MSQFVSEPDDIEPSNSVRSAAGAGASVDAAALEASKENIQPLRRGRNAAQLLHAIEVQNDAESLSAERQQREDAIKSYTGTDPIAPWLEYINWSQQTYLATTSDTDSHIIELLEKCTHQFKDSEQYRDDIRYLKVWLSYADCCRDADDIFAYLKTHKIGVTHSLLYTTWCRVAEHSAKYAFAEQVLSYAIGKKLAQPAAVLKTELASLQHRIKAIKAGANTSAAQLIEIAHSAEQARKPLSHLSKDRNVIANPTANGNAANANANGGSGNQSLSCGAVASTPKGKLQLSSLAPASADAKANRRVKIFADEPASATAAAAPASAAAAAAASAVGGLSASLLTDDNHSRVRTGSGGGAAAMDGGGAVSDSVRSKENMPVPAKWNDTPTAAPAISAAASLSSLLGHVPRASFTVFMDDECKQPPQPAAGAGVGAAATNANATPNTKPKPTLTLRARLDHSTPAANNIMPSIIPATAPNSLLKPRPVNATTAAPQPLATAAPLKPSAAPVTPSHNTTLAPVPAGGSVVKKTPLLAQRAGPIAASASKPIALPAGVRPSTIIFQDKEN